MQGVACNAPTVLLGQPHSLDDCDRNGGPEHSAGFRSACSRGEPGDWVKYGQVSGFWYIPFQDPPQFIKDAMATNWVRTEAVSVVDDDVTAAQTWSFDNATCQRSVTLTGNVQTGSRNLTIFIIAGALKAGDPINAMPLAPTLNKTIT